MRHRKRREGVGVRKLRNSWKKKIGYAYVYLHQIQCGSDSWPQGYLYISATQEHSTTLMNSSSIESLRGTCELSTVDRLALGRLLYAVSSLYVSTNKLPQEEGRRTTGQKQSS
eukprot:GHVS01030515.1.p1 GENE.GHVS01030515.1~~GHVS01030515.1.p1  ORF type:complete len:113 (-),score=8.30 GHVS01030515.1:392-730(-)